MCDWRKLYFGKVTKQEVNRYVRDAHWQRIRMSMKGLSTELKYKILCNYLAENPTSRAYQVRVTNYVTALSRGGIIKPNDYAQKTE